MAFTNNFQLWAQFNLKFFLSAEIELKGIKEQVYNQNQLLIKLFRSKFSFLAKYKAARILSFQKWGYTRVNQVDIRFALRISFYLKKQKRNKLSTNYSKLKIYL